MVNEKERLKIAGQIHGSGVYTRALEAARRELEDLLRERQGIDKRIIDRQRTVDALLAVCEEEGVQLPANLIPNNLASPIGFTDAVRQVLRESGIPIGPRTVRDRLIASGINMTKYSNPMVPVHNTLKRLCESGEVARSAVDDTGKFQYVWIGPIGKALERDGPPKMFGSNRNAIVNLTNIQIAEMAKPKRRI